VILPDVYVLVHAHNVRRVNPSRKADTVKTVSGGKAHCAQPKLVALRALPPGSDRERGGETGFGGEQFLRLRDAAQRVAADRDKAGAHLRAERRGESR